MGFLKSILHSSCFAVSRDLCICCNRFSCGLFINLKLSIPNLELIFLDCVLCLSSSGDSMFQSKSQISGISFQLLLHSECFSLTLGFGLKCGLHRIKSLCLVLSNHCKLLILFSDAALNFSLHLCKFHLAPEDFVFFLFQSCLSFFQSRL